VVYSERKHLTRDVSGSASTNQFADAVIAAMENTPAAFSAPASGRRKYGPFHAWIFDGARLQPRRPESHKHAGL